jgi:hypothetical protein
MTDRAMRRALRRNESGSERKVSYVAARKDDESVDSPSCFVLVKLEERNLERRVSLNRVVAEMTRRELPSDN